MVLAITTLANVKALSKSTDTADDALINSLIAQVSDQAQKTMRRHLDRIRRVDEDYDYVAYRPLLALLGAPVDSLSTILHSYDGDFSNSTALESSTYILNKRLGTVEFKRSAFDIYRNGYLRITYVGGMGIDQADFQAAFPDIEMAARYEVQNRLNRSAKPDGSTKLVEGAGTMYEKQLNQLTDYERALETRRRYVL